MKVRITDRRDKVWNGRCYHEKKNGKDCNKLCDEDTGKCPLGHGRSLHGCHTKCCVNWVSGNHKYCEFHRKAKLKSVCKITEKISREFRKRMWGKHNAEYDMERGSQGRKEFEQWSQKQIEKTYDQEILALQTNTKVSKE